MSDSFLWLYFPLLFQFRITNDRYNFYINIFSVHLSIFTYIIYLSHNLIINMQQYFTNKLHFKLIKVRFSPIKSTLYKKKYFFLFVKRFYAFENKNIAFCGKKSHTLINKCQYMLEKIEKIIVRFKYTIKNNNYLHLHRFVSNDKDSQLIKKNRFVRLLWFTFLLDRKTLERVNILAIPNSAKRWMCCRCRH